MSNCDFFFLWLVLNALSKVYNFFFFFFYFDAKKALAGYQDASSNDPILKNLNRFSGAQVEAIGSCLNTT